MIRWLIIGLVVCAVIFAAWYFLAGGGPALRSGRAQVNDLKAQLVAAQTRGDANAIASLTRQLATATNRQAALGDDSADPFGNQLADCLSSFDLINPIFSDIVATDRSDWLARGNKWRNALHFATDAQQCLSALALSDSTPEHLSRLRAAIITAGTKMRATQNRLYASSHGGESGLDAYSGSPEPGGDDKARAWLTGVVDPLWASLKVVDDKLSNANPADASVKAERDVLIAHPNSIDHSIFGV